MLIMFFYVLVIMSKSVIDLMPNVRPDEEVLLFHEYRLVEHYPFSMSSLLGMTLGEVLDLLSLTLPADCNYAYYRFRDHTTTVKEYGAYSYIINSKHLLKNAKNPSFGN